MASNVKKRGHHSEHTIQVRGEDGGEMVLSIAGRIAVDNVSQVMSGIESALGNMSPGSLAVDLSGVGYIDSAGALALWHLERKTADRMIPVKFVNVTDRINGILSLIDMGTLSAKPIISDRKERGFFEEVGDVTVRLLTDFVTLMTFLGDLIYGMVYSFFHPRAVRWNDVLFYMKRAGVNGLPIVGLIGFLLGFVIALMAFEQLRQFGGNVFIASVVSVAMVKEFGPIMTAILVAGRTGSAYAAEIGTMQVNEEVDALVTMGFDATRFLVIPKVLASILVVPLLTLYSDVLGMLGGMVIGTSIADLTVYAYIEQIPKSIDIFNVLSSLAKALIFAIIISGIGCQRGFRVRGGAEDVGISTTSAVVSAIFLVIVMDAAFAIILDYIT